MGLAVRARQGVKGDAQCCWVDDGLHTVCAGYLRGLQENWCCEGSDHGLSTLSLGAALSQPTLPYCLPPLPAAPAPLLLRLACIIIEAHLAGDVARHGQQRQERAGQLPPLRPI